MNTLCPASQLNNQRGFSIFDALCIFGYFGNRIPEIGNLWIRIPTGTRKQFWVRAEILLFKTFCFVCCNRISLNTLCPASQLNNQRGFSIFDALCIFGYFGNRIPEIGNLWIRIPTGTRKQFWVRAEILLFKTFCFVCCNRISLNTLCPASQLNNQRGFSIFDARCHTSFLLGLSVQLLTGGIPQNKLEAL